MANDDGSLPNTDSTVGNDGISRACIADATKTETQNRFFFDDDPMVIFVVQGVQYHVHRYFSTRDSQNFHDVFLEQPSDSRHLELSAAVKTSDNFDPFLSILYPKTFGQIELSTAKEWISVLQLSSEWGFTSIRAMAIKFLQSLVSPIDRIVLGNDFGIDRWIAPGYIALCARPHSLTLAEVKQLQMKDVVSVTTIRENILCSGQEADEEAIAG
ncbi:hypothetical protein OF83DRAFT_1170360 [Amylostereum chailletii]|nr:hypothetical protein OF83DRAFT_1170360 [Amylostereum chailletii]